MNVAGGELGHAAWTQCFEIVIAASKRSLSLEVGIVDNYVMNEGPLASQSRMMIATRQT